MPGISPYYKHAPSAPIRHLGSWFTTNHPSTNTVFISDVTNNVVDIFDYQQHRQIGQIGNVNIPEGLATDSAGYLYESDTLSQDVQVFAPPYTGKPQVLEDQGEYPVGLHVDASGNVWVANICSGFGGACINNGNVVWYKAGLKGAAKALSGGPGRPYFVTTDRHGNVWADGQVSEFDPTPMIGYWPGGTGSFVTVPISFVFPGGMQFDANGNLLLDDQAGASNGASVIYIYGPGQTTPKSTYTIQTNGEDVVTFALGVGQKRVFAPGALFGVCTLWTYPDDKMGVNTLVPKVLGSQAAIATLPAPSP
ncbi:MAG TPA: hypothetical protein VGZ02_05780 [Candidatus Baltobacteraceae bacterium]|jgi:hypothetical protein|nr:hypothetical protein [Candidatus Baltobacteraceae bacterium]